MQQPVKLPRGSNPRFFYVVAICIVVDEWSNQVFGFVASKDKDIDPPYG